MANYDNCITGFVNNGAINTLKQKTFSLPVRDSI